MAGHPDKHRVVPVSTEEKGNSIAAFVLIIPLVFLVIFAVISLIYVLHIRFLAEDAVFEGARAGALSGGNTELAKSRTRDALDVAFHEEYCAHPDITTHLTTDGGIEVTLYCPAQKNPWFSSTPEMTVSVYAQIE